MGFGIKNSSPIYFKWQQYAHNHVNNVRNKCVHVGLALGLRTIEKKPAISALAITALITQTSIRNLVVALKVKQTCINRIFVAVAPPGNAIAVDIAIRTLIRSSAISRASTWQFICDPTLSLGLVAIVRFAPLVYPIHTSVAHKILLHSREEQIIPVDLRLNFLFPADGEKRSRVTLISPTSMAKRGLYGGTKPQFADFATASNMGTLGSVNTTNCSSDKVVSILNDLKFHTVVCGILDQPVVFRYDQHSPQFFHGEPVHIVIDFFRCVTGE